MSKHTFTLFTFLTLIASCFLSAVADEPVYTVKSPNGAVVITITQRESAPTYAVTYNDKAVLNDSQTGLKLRDIDTVQGWKFVGKSDASSDTTWTFRFGKKSTYRDNYNQTTLTYVQGALQFSYIFRAYDDGLAFRYELKQEGESKQYVVDEDLTQYAFPDDFHIWSSPQRYFNTNQEGEFKKTRLSTIRENSILVCPIVIETPEFCTAIMEADLYDWSGMKFASVENGTTTLKTRLTPRRDKNGFVVFNTPTQSPWRVFLLGRKPVDLINNSGVMLNVSKPSQIGDDSWVEPGVSAWDWWSGSNKIMTTETTIDRIDLASEMGWKYLTIDDPWYWSSFFRRIPGQAPDTTRAINSLDWDKILAHAKAKNVRLCLWLHYWDLKRCGVEPTFKKYQQWGIAGVKIDFMDSENQETVNWINETAAIGAKYHLLVNYHGMYKPTGLERGFPNQITREAIRGNEFNKSANPIGSINAATLPFTRFLCGPGDYTPGGTLNCQPEKFVYQRRGVPSTRVIGTRAHEMALCILFDSPIMTLCDAPENYRGVAGTEILKNLPAAWDETTAVEGEIAQYLVQTRRLGDRFYAGAITDTNPRKCELKLDFLKAGKTYTALIVKDVPESAKDATKVLVETIDVTANDTLTIDMVRNGGWCARFEEK